MKWRRRFSTLGWDDWYPRSTPRRVKNGIRARSRHGKIGSTWWSSRWLEALESFGLGSRLERGRRYARMGQVIDMKLSKCLVEARVQGSRPKPYDITIKVKPIADEKWREVFKVMGSQALFSAKLLAGEMPENIEEAFKSSDAPLFPKRKEIQTDCSCPDYENPCKHIAAVYYILTEEFDKDPFMIFQLRGRSKKETIEFLRRSRPAPTREPVTKKGTPQPIDRAQEETRTIENEGERAKSRSKSLTLEECICSFWASPKSLEQFNISMAQPHVNAAVIKRLGEPSFWREHEDFTKLMAEVYEKVTRKALDAAFKEEDDTQARE